jgi:predicted DNA repair protein MutK
MTGGFFALLDDIATLLDDAAVVSKVAAKKTTGILGDDLAVNAQKASGFASSRELPVLWAITKGSFRNKLIILPIAFLLSAFASWAIIPILMLGGIYLAYEGAEKIYEYLAGHKEKGESQIELSEEELLKVEAKKIKSAITTDFILSIEIVIVALGTVMEQPLVTQIIAVTIVAFLATVGVYGLVALLVRMDDFGFALIEKADDESSLLHKLGRLLVVSLPKVIRALTVIGTFAMLLVAGGIFMHNIHQLHELLHFIPSLLAEMLVGLVIGSIAFGVHMLYVKVFGKEASH